MAKLQNLLLKSEFAEDGVLAGKPVANQNVDTIFFTGENRIANYNSDVICFRRSKKSCCQLKHSGSRSSKGDEDCSPQIMMDRAHYDG